MGNGLGTLFGLFFFSTATTLYFSSFTLPKTTLNRFSRQTHPQPLQFLQIFGLPPLDSTTFTSSPPNLPLPPHLQFHLPLSTSFLTPHSLLLLPPAKSATPTNPLPPPTSSQRLSGLPPSLEVPAILNHMLKRGSPQTQNNKEAVLIHKKKPSGPEWAFDKVDRVVDGGPRSTPSGPSGQSSQTRPSAQSRHSRPTRPNTQSTQSRPSAPSGQSTPTRAQYQ